MSAWTHAVCDECWMLMEPNRMPVKVRVDRMESAACACCRCGKTTDGIFVRGDPKVYPCKGEGGTHVGDS